MTSAAISSKAARLRCFHYLLKAQPQLDKDSKLIKNMIPEIVLACKDINEKCRSTAYQVLQTIGDRLIHQDQGEDLIHMLVIGLAGTSQMISCTILAFASLLHHFSGAIGQDNINKLMQTVTTLMSSPTNEVVASCLAFIKVYITSLPNTFIGASLSVIVQSLSSMTEHCKRHFRLKTRGILERLVRKFGPENISPFIPAEDTVMHKRLRNLRKLNSRKKKQKEQSKNMDSDDDDEFILNAKPKSVEEILADSDSDFEDMETDEPKVKTKKIETWIKEDPESIIDFNDPTVNRKITASKPGHNPIEANMKKKETNRGFKTSSDGKLIIKDDSSDDETEKKKDKISFNLSDSDDDSVETLPLTNRKRKRSSASSVKSGISATSSKAFSVKSGISATSSKASKYKTGGVGIHRKVGSAYGETTAAEYRSKKAKGDVKKKNKLDPYAYLPLQRTTLNKRKKKKAISQFKNIVRAVKKGASVKKHRK
ncbi:hypothetical protein WA026_012189 [Henosepilachna vigintioctopunctata]|uniref:RRP12-like protein n=1 Tax=Henosepilachna vigintioctopunctata TaxID=420089 RepID=A0AAW1V6U3_9CUCU